MWKYTFQHLERSHKANKLMDLLALLSIIYGITFIFLDVFILDYPKNSYDWYAWGFKLLFNGLILPILGFVNRVSNNKLIKLTNQIHKCVVSEMKLIQQLTINTQKLTVTLLNIKPTECINFRKKE